MKEKELRNCKLEVRAENDSRKIEGYAIVFNKESRDLGGFIEIVEPEAVEGLIDKSDILCLLNHNQDKGVLARSKFGKGSLSLNADSTGLKYSFDAPNTDLGNEVLEGIKRGDITTSSFAFTIEKDEWENTDKGYIRRIKKFAQLYDVSPVYQEAYPDTSVACRSLDKLNAEDLKEYYKQLKQDLF